MSEPNSMEIYPLAVVQFKTTNLMVVLEEKSGDHQVMQIHWHANVTMTIRQDVVIL